MQSPLFTKIFSEKLESTKKRPLISHQTYLQILQICNFLFSETLVAGTSKRVWTRCSNLFLLHVKAKSPPPTVSTRAEHFVIDTQTTWLYCQQYIRYLKTLRDTSFGWYTSRSFSGIVWSGMSVIFSSISQGYRCSSDEAFRLPFLKDAIISVFSHRLLYCRGCRGRNHLLSDSKIKF